MQNGLALFLQGLRVVHDLGEVASVLVELCCKRTLMNGPGSNPQSLALNPVFGHCRVSLALTGPCFKLSVQFLLGMRPFRGQGRYTARARACTVTIACNLHVIRVICKHVSTSSMIRGSDLNSFRSSGSHIETRGVLSESQDADPVSICNRSLGNLRWLYLSKAGECSE